MKEVQCTDRNYAKEKKLKALVSLGPSLLSSEISLQPVGHSRCLVSFSVLEGESLK